MYLIISEETNQMIIFFISFGGINENRSCVKEFLVWLEGGIKSLVITILLGVIAKGGVGCGEGIRLMLEDWSQTEESSKFH